MDVRNGGGNAFVLILPACLSSPAVGPALNESHSSGKLQITENREKFHFIYFAFCFFDFSTVEEGRGEMGRGVQDTEAVVIRIRCRLTRISASRLCPPRVVLFVRYIIP